MQKNPHITFESYRFSYEKKDLLQESNIGLYNQDKVTKLKEKVSEFNTSTTQIEDIDSNKETKENREIK